MLSPQQIQQAQQRLGSQPGAQGSKPSAADSWAQYDQESKSPQSDGYHPIARTPGEGLLAGAAKSIENIPGSGMEFLKSIGNIVAHPIKTAEGVSSVIAGGAEKLERKAVEPVASAITGHKVEVAPLPQEEHFNALATALKDRYGSIENLKKTLTEDPVGAATDIASVFAGGAGAVAKVADVAKLGKVAEVARGAEKVANAANPVNITAKGVGKVVDMTKNAAGVTGKYGTAIATGLNPETISAVIKNPESFSKSAMAQTTREGIGENVLKGIKDRIDELSHTGKEYGAIRKSGESVNIPQGTVSNILGKYGIDLVPDEGGKLRVQTTEESHPISSQDETAIQKFVNTFGDGGVKSSNAFLNARKALDNMSDWEAGKTDMADVISRELRHEFDTHGKQQLTGLADLDAKFAPEVKLLNNIKRDYLKPGNGELKDNALNKLANLTGKGKSQILARLEQIRPGVTKEINILKAVEDVEHSTGMKVGTYARGGLTAGAVTTGNIPLLVGMILAHPPVAINILSHYGKILGKTTQFTERVVNKMSSGMKLNPEQKKFLHDAMRNSVVIEKIKDQAQPQDDATEEEAQ